MRLNALFLLFSYHKNAYSFTFTVEYLKGQKNINKMMSFEKENILWNMFMKFILKIFGISALALHLLNQILIIS